MALKTRAIAVRCSSGEFWTMVERLIQMSEYSFINKRAPSDPRKAGYNFGYNLAFLGWFLFFGSKKQRKNLSEDTKTYLPPDKTSLLQYLSKQDRF